MEIKVGQKFLSGGVEVEIVCVTGKVQGYPVIDDYGDCYTVDGLCNNDDEYHLQPIPEPEIVIPEGVTFCGPEYANTFNALRESGRKFVYDADDRWKLMDEKDSFLPFQRYRIVPVTITEGVEFSGEQYRQRFNELVEAGREFEYLVFTKPDTWKRESKFVGNERYRLVPQHRDAVGNPLKVGDRVECEGERFTIQSFQKQYALKDIRTGYLLSNCRKLTTRTRPLCADDLEKAMCPQIRFDGWSGSVCWSDEGVAFNGNYPEYDNLQGYEWRPSADKPWQPCEVEEEVPV